MYSNIIILIAYYVCFIFKYFILNLYPRLVCSPGDIAHGVTYVKYQMFFASFKKKVI